MTGISTTANVETRQSSLTGRRIVITRPRLQSAALAEKLAALGAEPILLPLIEIEPSDDTSALDEAIRRGGYDWVVFTSVNGVSAFWARLAALNVDQAWFDHTNVAAIGPATAAALEGRGVRPALVPEQFVAEAILDTIGDVNGRRILLPRADIARKALADGLRRRGAEVHEIDAYRNVPVAPEPEALAIVQRGVDAVTFTSSSTVRSFVALNLDLGKAIVACIGPVTADTAREVGLPVDVVAAEYTTGGLVAALLEYFAGRPPLEER